MTSVSQACRRPVVAVLVLALAATLLSAATSPVPAAADPRPGFAPGVPVVEAGRSVRATAWGPLRNQGLACQWYSGDTACVVDMGFSLDAGWADWQAQMRAAGATLGRVSIARACPADAQADFTRAIVLNLDSQRFTTNVTVGCDYSKYYTVPSAAVPWDFEWYFPQAGAWAKAGWPVPAAEPPPPLHYAADTPVRESASRAVTDTAWGHGATGD